MRTYGRKFRYSPNLSIRVTGNYYPKGALLRVENFVLTALIFALASMPLLFHPERIDFPSKMGRIPASTITNRACTNIIRPFLVGTEEYLTIFKDQLSEDVLELIERLEKLEHALKSDPTTLKFTRKKIFQIDLFKFIDEIDSSTTVKSVRKQHRKIEDLISEARGLEKYARTKQRFNQLLEDAVESIKSKFDPDLYQYRWSNHNNKHTKFTARAGALDLPDKKAMAKKISESEAQYFPEINNKFLERWVLDNFTESYPLDRKKGGVWFFVYFDSPIGYNSGKETRWIRIEVQSGTFHGHPALEPRVRKEIGSAAAQALILKPVKIPNGVLRK